jgi:LacI family transcriptional regulator
MEPLDGFAVSVEVQKKSRLRAFSAIINVGTPIVGMFDRIAEGVDCDKVIVDDFDSAIAIRPSI